MESTPLCARTEKMSLNQLMEQIEHDFRLGKFSNQKHIDKLLSKNNEYLIGTPEECLSFFEEIIENTRTKKKDALKLAKLQPRKDIADDRNLATSMYFGVDKAWYDALPDGKAWMKDFTQSILKQLEKDHGKEAIKSFIVHWDEPFCAPHIQAIIAPICTVTSKNRYGTKTRQAVSHAALFVDKITEMKFWRATGQTAEKSKLGKWQTRYAEAVAHLGVVRGEENAWYRKHEPCRRPEEQEAPDVTPPLPPMRKKTHYTDKDLEYAKNLESNALGWVKDETIAQALRDAANRGYNQAISDCTGVYDTVAEQANKARALKIRNGVLERRHKRLQTEHKQQAKMMKRYYSKQMQEQVRTIDIPSVCEALGLIHRKELGRNEKHDYCSPDKLIAIDYSKTDKGLWKDFKNDKAGHGAIDLIMYVNRCDFQEAMQWAIDRFGIYATTETEVQRVSNQKREQVQKIDAMPRKKFVRPERAYDEASIKQLKDYMAKRGIDNDITERLLKRGEIYATKQGNYTNIVFCTGDKAAEVKGINTSFKGLSKSSTRQDTAFELLSGKEKPQSIMLFESALDLLSYKQLHPEVDNRLLCSVSGVGTNSEQKWVLEKCAKMGIKEVLIAYDNDEPGEQASTKLAAILAQNGISVREVKPPKTVKDWNQILQDKVKEEERKKAQKKANNVSTPIYQATVTPK